MTFPTFDATQAVERPRFTTYPFLHATGRMPWGAARCSTSPGSTTDLLSGQTGRNIDTNREPRNWQEMRDRVGHCGYAIIPKK